MHKLLQSYDSLVKRIFLFLLVVLLSVVARAQEEVTAAWIDNWEELAMESEENVDWESELEELEQRLQEPLNLNTATREQLRQFPFLSDLQIENLQAYIYLHGQMETIYELQLVEEMDKRTIDLLLPFVCVKKVEQERGFPKLKNIIRYGKHELMTRFDLPFYTREGYRKNYLGTRQYHNLQYRFRYGDYLQVGVSGEKDAGEPFFALHDNQGYDHYSYYIQLKHLGRLENLVLGSYRLSFGQGLVLGNSFGLGKSFSLATSDYRATSIRKHSSTDEYSYLWGAAATVRVARNLSLSAFYSHRTMDGVLKDGVITSIYKDGLHRTEGEVEKMDSLNMQLAGGNIGFEHNRFHVGLTGIYYRFSHPYEPSYRKYAKYNLHGQDFYNLGLDYQLRLGRFNWAGEAAKGKKGVATVNRLSYRFSPEYRVMLVHRYYAHDYWAYYARSFGEGSMPQNENGWYLAAEVEPFARWRFFASVDMFSFPWWKYRISKPSQGVDGMLQATFSPRSELVMSLSYRLKRKERDVTGTSGEITLPTWHHRLRYRLNYTPGNWQLRTTIDYNHFRQDTFEGSQGFMITQMATLALTRFPLKLSLQGSYFCTDDYDTRVYAYERGLLNTFYTPSFYGRGFRYTVHARYDWGTRLMLLLKLGQTIYQDRETIGSGNDQIAGNKKTDLQLQLRVKF